MNGEACTLPANGPSGFCWAHSPENAEKRSRTASKAAKSKGNRELTRLKDEIKGVIMDVRSGDLDRNAAAVMLQGYRTLKDYVALERQIREQDEILGRIAELEQRRRTNGGPRQEAL